MNENITIIMATYNGAHYVREQLESIVMQTYDNWTLNIRDDKSTDGTVDIIKEYCQKDTRIHFVEGERLGAVGNFNELLMEARNEKYVMLCDQDDVWDKQKVEKTIQLMVETEERYKDRGILIYTDKTDADENLNVIQDVERTYKDDFTSTLAQCHIYGCTMMLNRKLINKVIPIPKYAYTHDYWIALCALTDGIVKKLNESTMYYRQHSNNFTGGTNNYSLVNKMKTWKKTNISDSKQIYQNICFCKEHRNVDEAAEFLNLFDLKGIKRIKRAKKMGLVRDRRLGTLRYYYNLMKYRKRLEEQQNE